MEHKKSALIANKSLAATYHWDFPFLIPENILVRTTKKTQREREQEMEGRKIKGRRKRIRDVRE